MSQDGMRLPTISILVLMPKLLISLIKMQSVSDLISSAANLAATVIMQVHFADNPYTLNRAAYQDGSMHL